MGLVRRIRSILFKKKKSKEEEENFLLNGSELQAEVLAFFDGQYDIPIRGFTSRELTEATENFAECVFSRHGTVMFRGQFGGRKVLINRWTGDDFHFGRHGAIIDIVIASHMSHLKNVLKLVGYCLELDCPASVHEDTQGYVLLSDLLDTSHGRFLSWRNRIRIAISIASTILYLHTMFATPVIYRNLKPSKVIVDQYGGAKLFDFSCCISLPPGELYVEDLISGTFGFLDPEYAMSGYITQKTDVYGFGMLLLAILTSKNPIWINDEGEYNNLFDYVKQYVDNGLQYRQLIDPRILEEINKEVGIEKLLESFLDLALMCIRFNGEDRPDMIDVAKEIRLIEKGVFHPLPKTSKHQLNGSQDFITSKLDSGKLDSLLAALTAFFTNFFVYNWAN